LKRDSRRRGIIRDGRLITVETIESLLGKRFRRMTLTFGEPVVPDPFAAIPGVSDVRAEGHAITLHTSGSMDAIVKLAAQHRLADLSVERPTLEEIFLTYYGAHK
jgi:ABC-2 type transport system ATP-binding protein